MELSNPLGEFLREYRNTHQMTMMDLAQRCQVNMSAIMGVEQGDRADPELVKALAEGLHMTVDDLRRIERGDRLTLTIQDTFAPVATADTQQALQDAIHELSDAQAEKVLDFITLLKLAERGRRTLGILSEPPSDS